MQVMRVATAIALSVGLSAGTLAIATPALAAPRTSVNNCGELQVKPTDLVLACADANTMLTGLRWTRWSNGSARAVGTYEVNDCTPTCVAGTTRDYRVRVTLNQPKAQSGKRVFTKATITFSKAGPGGRKAISWRPNRYAPQQATPTPTAVAPSANATASAAPAPTATASASPSATATATASATATAAATARPTATATVAAIAPPAAKLQKSEVFQSSKLRLSITADSKAGGDRRGIRSVTVYRPNEYNAELETKASYVGVDTANQNEWTALLTCDRTDRSKDTLRIVVTANDGQTTTLRETVQPSSC